MCHITRQGSYGQTDDTNLASWTWAFYYIEANKWHFPKILQFNCYKLTRISIEVGPTGNVRKARASCSFSRDDEYLSESERVRSSSHTPYKAPLLGLKLLVVARGRVGKGKLLLSVRYLWKGGGVKAPHLNFCIAERARTRADYSIIFHYPDSCMCVAKTEVFSKHHPLW
jgi:hypothetical protein